jgi:hypothetical protein
VLVPLLSLDARTRGLKGAAIATDRLSLPSSIIHAFEENSRDFSQPLLFIYKIHLFPFTHPLAERILAIIYFSQESTYQKETTRAIFKSRVYIISLQILRVNKDCWKTWKVVLHMRMI